LKDAFGSFSRFKTKRRDSRPGFEHLKNFRSKGRGQVAEVQIAAFARSAEILPGALIRVNNLQITINDHARVAQFAQDTRE